MAISWKKNLTLNYLPEHFKSALSIFPKSPCVRAFSSVRLSPPSRCPHPPPPRPLLSDLRNSARSFRRGFER